METEDTKQEREYHVGFEVYPDCQALSVGDNGTKDHIGQPILIEITSGFSKGRRTRACQNHLQGYLTADRHGASSWGIVCSRCGLVIDINQDHYPVCYKLTNQEVQQIHHQLEPRG